MPNTIHDIANVPGPVTATFRGGSRHGQTMALPEPMPTIEFAVPATTPYWIGTDPALPIENMRGTEIYRATTRHVALYHPQAYNTALDVTIPYYPTTAASNYTISIEYTAAGTINDAYTADGNWVGHANEWRVQVDNQLWPLSAPLTPEQEAERARKLVRDDRRKVLAHKRARRLLLNLLSDEQQHEYAQSKAFTVIAKNGKVFRLRKGKTAELLGADGSPIASYCIHLPYGYNHEDTLIALLLSLQTDPAEFEQIANITQLRRPDLAVGARQLATAMRDAGEAARHAAEHIRETQALLRAEGCSEAEIEALRHPPNQRNGLLVAA